METDRKDFDRTMDLLDQVVTKVASQHSMPHDFGTGVPLYRVEIHTVQAVGENPGINVTALSEHMGVSKGAASQTISKLVKKGLVIKKSAPDNERETLLELTDLGLTAHHAHEGFHEAMFEEVKRYFGESLPEKIDTFVEALTDLNDFLDEIGEQKRPE